MGCPDYKVHCILKSGTRSPKIRQTTLNAFKTGMLILDHGNTLKIYLFPTQTGSLDTLNSIALKFNITPNKLVELNKLFTHTVVPGQVIVSSLNVSFKPFDRYS